MTLYQKQIDEFFLIVEQKLGITQEDLIERNPNYQDKVMEHTFSKGIKEGISIRVQMNGLYKIIKDQFKKN